VGSELPPFSVTWEEQRFAPPDPHSPDLRKSLDPLTHFASVSTIRRPACTSLSIPRRLTPRFSTTGRDPRLSESTEGSSAVLWHDNFGSSSLMLSTARPSSKWGHTFCLPPRPRTSSRTSSQVGSNLRSMQSSEGVSPNFPHRTRRDGRRLPSERQAGIPPLAESSKPPGLHLDPRVDLCWTRLRTTIGHLRSGVQPSVLLPRPRTLSQVGSNLRSRQKSEGVTPNFLARHENESGVRLVHRTYYAQQGEVGSHLLSCRPGREPRLELRPQVGSTFVLCRSQKV